MKRTGGIAALTIAAVLVAGGTAAALNTKVLDPTGSTPVGTADSIVPSGEPTPDESSSGLGSPTGVSLTPEPDDTSAEETESPEATAASSSTRTSRPSATRTKTSRPSSSSSRPHASSSESESHGGSDDSSPEPSETRSDD